MNQRNPQDIRSPNLVVVEGKDDREFIDFLLRKLNIMDYQIIELKGKNNLHKTLPTLTKTSGFENVRNLAIFLDANSSVINTFRSIQSALKKAQLPVPSEPNQVVHGKVNLGVFLFPDCQSPGALEDLIVKTIDFHMLECIKDYLSCVQKYKAEFQLSVNSKSVVYSYFAVQDEPSQSFDLALKRGHIDLESPEFDKVKSFLKQLFRT